MAESFRIYFQSTCSIERYFSAKEEAAAIVTTANALRAEAKVIPNDAITLIIL